MKDDFRTETNKIFALRQPATRSFFESGWSADGTPITGYDPDILTPWYMMKLRNLPERDCAAVLGILDMNRDAKPGNLFSAEAFTMHHGGKHDDTIDLLSRLTALHILRQDKLGLYSFIDRHAENWYRHYTARTGSEPKLRYKPL